MRSGSVSSGYAAGCEAKATPRRKGLTNVELCPSFGLWPKTLGHSPYRGRSPSSSVQSAAGHSPRRTPDGKAEANTPGKDVPSMNAFVCKLSASQEERLVGQRLVGSGSLSSGSINSINGALPMKRKSNTPICGA